MSRVLGPKHLDEPIITHARRDYVALRSDQTVGQALETLRSKDIGEKIVYFYVVDGNGKLVGVVPTRRLLMTGPQVPIAEIMVDRVASIPATASVLTACEFFIQYRFLAFPVVDDESRLVGIADVSLFTDEVMGLAEKRSAERAFQIIGVNVALGRRVSGWVSFKDRFPWLLCNIAGGLLCALLAGLFESLLDAAVVLALFIPVVLALGESVSIQSMTLTLAALQQERVDWTSLLRSLRKELVTAMLLGAGSGLLVAGVALVWKGESMVAGAIGLSILLSVVTASLLGVLVPTAVHAFRGDPRIAAGPISLASTDMATILLYFSLAGWFLAH